MTDYIIVGGGAAGAVLAARLSEHPTTEVLLLEAGPDLRRMEWPSAIRAANPKDIIGDPEHARFRWDGLAAARTEVQSPTPFWRGRGVGGSTLINGMFAVRGEPEDHDAWADAGCPGWAWTDVLPWFRRLEDDLDFGDRPYHGVGGPYPIWRPPLDGWGPVDLAVREAALDLGYPWCDDHNAPHSTGVSPYAASIRDGERVSTADAYLDPVRDRVNLRVIAGVLVDRVIIEHGRAVGVSYIADGATVRAEAAHVVLAAGAVHSPAILLRSGVGPPDQLTSFDIDVKAPLVGVGANLSDHPIVEVLVFGPTDDSWAAANGRHGSCYLRYSSEAPGTGTNDMAILSLTYPGTGGGPSVGIVGPAVWQPFSRGSLTLASRDPHVDPLIAERMLSDRRDLERMRDGLRRVLELLDRPWFRSVGGARRIGRSGGVMHRVPAALDAAMDRDLDRIALESASDTQHIVGTCRMGDPDDSGAVVDPSGQVLGVAGLRVIDASVIPACPRANTVLTVIMLAEKMAAEIIAAGIGP